MIQMLTSVIGQRGVDAMAFLLAFALTALTDSIFRDKLPHDHGRAFAVNGELSKGKARGSGVIFVLCIALVSLAFSAVIELGQLTGLFFLFRGAYRLCDVDELMLNTRGGLLGGELVRTLEAYLPPLDAFDRYPGSAGALPRLG